MYGLALPRLGKCLTSESSIGPSVLHAEAVCILCMNNHFLFVSHLQELIQSKGRKDEKMKTGT